MISSGTISYREHFFRWELFVNDVAILTNGSGEILISCPEDVIAFDLNLVPVPKPFEPFAIIETSPDGVYVYRLINDERELIAKLQKIKEDDVNNERRVFYVDVSGVKDAEAYINGIKKLMKDKNRLSIKD